MPEASVPPPNVVVFYHRGMVERCRKGGRYQWYDGWSGVSPSGGILYPWMTKTEARAWAKARGVKAEFSREAKGREWNGGRRG